VPKASQLMEDSSLTYKYFDTFKNDKLLFVYMGALSNHMVISSINLIEKNISKDNDFRKLRHKLSFLMIESFQNIIRYGDEPVNKQFRYRKEMFMVRNIGGTFYIGSVNLIENKKIKYVNQKLQEVNRLDGKELNELYRKILTNNQFTQAGGAGLGFIEMARKTSQKLHFDFEEIDDTYSYFYLLIKVKCKTAEAKEKKVKLDVNIDWLKEFHEETYTKNLIVMHKGNFSPVVIDPVISMVENNIESKAVNVQKLTFHIILEALQNLSLHSLEKNDEKEAIFIIRQQGKKHFISTGNHIKQTKVTSLKTQLDEIKKMPIKKIRKHYEEGTHKKDIDDSSLMGLGLMEIALESKNKFAYTFIPESDDVSFYTFDVEV
jgi:hypothetical protein